MSFRLRLVVCGAAAICLWLLAVNRVLIQMEDGGMKTLCVALSAGACFALARHAVRQRERRWLLGAAAVLLLCTLGEVHRAWLRSAYALTTPAPEAWVVPVTTTDLRTTTFELPPRSPRSPRLRVAHLTDLHISDGLPAEYFGSLHERILSTEPDVLVMTGDYVSRADRLPLLRDWLAGLPAQRLGSFAVLGNHDHWTGEAAAISAALASAGVEVLSGRCVTIEPAAVRLCGTEAPWGPGLDGWTGPALTTIALSHTPDNVYDLHDLGADVVFAGHTHGGQVRLPGLGSVIVPSRFGRRFDRGSFDVEGTQLIVSAGVGADAPPLRLWCQPELVVVDL